MVRVGVIGAGVVGLSTARVLLETIPDVEVVVMAENFGPNTTSDGAAGIFRPGLQFAGPTRQITEQWLVDSHAYITKMLKDRPEEAADAGIIKIKGYHFSSEYPKIVKNFFLEDILDVYRPCTEQELSLYGFRYGSYYETFLVDCTKHLPYLMDLIRSKGGRIIRHKVANFGDLSGEFDVICNCAGLGARDLCDDYHMTPIRGQVFKVKAPWIKSFTYADYDTYIVPGVKYVTLGGCRQFDSWTKEIDKYDSASIWDRCTKLVPSLKNAEIVKEWVGFRPYRSQVRVEKELVKMDNGDHLQVVHNYGHGGYGVMTASGTAVHAAKLVKDIVHPSAKL